MVLSSLNMKKTLFIIISFLTLVGSILRVSEFLKSGSYIYGAPPFGEAESDVPSFGTTAWFDHWVRPDGPAKVAIQVGHYLNNDLPEELEVLRNSNGTTGGGKAEWEVNNAIAKETATMLRREGVLVEILPATIPPSYWADVFISIHADGSLDKSKRGFKIAAPWRDFTNGSQSLVTYLYESYSDATNFEEDDNITRNMRGYYAFSWWRYKHAIHPMTTAAIIETGFLTNSLDQNLLIANPELPARGIAEGVLTYLITEGLL